MFSRIDLRLDKRRVADAIEVSRVSPNGKGPSGLNLLSGGRSECCRCYFYKYVCNQYLPSMELSKLKHF